MPTTHAHHAPNAALLIDFDNVTMGIRSDLAKELRTLLNSDIIKGKVAVQRAYADWRRYPQYIVSLSESSIDLIFAPAFGTAKKNATDIRLAVDAIELVFTRPEIGTFILLSGDSDFSSMVLKLKEYGKYVIGVGMKESASDILIQNCDEYYSYSDLAGLSKESELPPVPRDPWEVVGEAVRRMAENRDVMRSDRLKQVMQQIDPAFDERNVGMNRFSKFVSEAASRGLITITKLENGQLEVSPVAGASRSAPASRPAATGGGAPSAAPAESADAREERGGRRRRGRGGRGRGRSGEEGAAPSETPSPRAAAVAAAPTGLTLAEAFHLLSRALGELPTPVAHETLRARMSALHGQEDPLLATERFPRLLRQANDAEVADVRQLEDGHFEVSAHKADLALQMAARRHAEPARSGGSQPASAANEPVTSSSAAPRPGGVRFRGGARSTAPRSAAPPMVGVIELAPVTTPTALPVDSAPAPAPVATTGKEAAKKAPARGGKKAAPKAQAPAPKAKAAARPAATKAAKTAAPAKKAAKEKTPSATKPSKPRSR